MNTKLVFLIIFGIALFADDEPISADRPGFSTGTQTLDPGIAHVELGYQYQFNNHGINQSTHTFPLMVLRTGVSERGEFDILWDGVNIDKEEGSSKVTSKADFSVGGKYSLHESERYNWTLLGILSLPTGTSPSTSESVDPLIGLLWDYSLSEENALFGTFQTSSSRSESHRIYDAQFAIGTSVNHTPTVASFLEFYTLMPLDSHLPDTRVIDGGMTYLWSKDTQLDFNIGIGLTKESSSYVGFGIASRFSY